jgi:REP element-mobilizing transposase RayT
MARPLRIQFAGAICHVLARGNGRQRLFHGEDDYQRVLQGLERTALRTGWEVFSFVWMPNHVHLFFRTPQPNLANSVVTAAVSKTGQAGVRGQSPLVTTVCSGLKCLMDNDG